MPSFPDTSINAAGMPVPMPGTGAATAIIAELQNGIPPETIARRIREMLEATSPGPNGTEGPDWRTIEAGMKLYLAFLYPAAADGCSVPVPAAQTWQDAALYGVVRKEPDGKQQQLPVARESPRRQQERLEFMRRMMVLDTDVLTSRRDAEGRPIPRYSPSTSKSWSRSTSTAAASGTAGSDPLVLKGMSPLPSKSSVFRKPHRLALLAGCLAIVWIGGNSLRDLAFAHPVAPQVGPSRPRPVSPAVTAQPPQSNEGFKDWFADDLQAEYTYDPYSAD